MTEHDTEALSPTPWFRRPITLIGAGILLVALAAAAVLFFTLQPGTRDLTVNFALLDYRSSCTGGTGGYDDVRPGMPVVVRDNNGKVIATGELGSDGQPVDVGVGPKVGCQWTAVVPNVPAGGDYYSVEVGHRGQQIYTGDQLAKKSWSINLSLGTP